MDGRFSRDEHGWRTEAAVKVELKIRGEPQAKLHGRVFFGSVSFARAKEMNALRKSAINVMRNSNANLRVRTLDSCLGILRRSTAYIHVSVRRNDRKVTRHEGEIKSLDVFSKSRYRH